VVSDFTIDVYIWTVVILFCFILSYVFGSRKDKKEVREMFTLKGIMEFFEGLGALIQVCFGLLILLLIVIGILWFLKFVWHALPV